VNIFEFIAENTWLTIVIILIIYVALYCIIKGGDV
jgi:hypothetical protein